MHNLNGFSYESFIVPTQHNKASPVAQGEGIMDTLYTRRWGGGSKIEKFGGNLKR